MKTPPAGLRSKECLRLTFSWNGQQASLVQLETIRSIPPPGDPLEFENQAGAWLLLMDKDQKPIYRRIIALADNSVETFDDQGVPTRESVEGENYLFEVVVPKQETDAYIVLEANLNDSQGTRTLLKIPLTGDLLND